MPGSRRRDNKDKEDSQRDIQTWYRCVVMPSSALTTCAVIGIERGAFMFWAWLLKYSSFLLTGAVSLIVGLVIHRLTTRWADLIYYNSHPQWVQLPPREGQEQMPPIGTFTLFLWNQGKAPARNVHIGHYWLPANNVFPDITREVSMTPGGGQAIRIPVVPPKTLISISYLYFGTFSAEQIISYVGSEEGAAKRFPVILQRVLPRWFIAINWVVYLLGVWVAFNLLVSLTRFLWRVYYQG